MSRQQNERAYSYRMPELAEVEYYRKQWDPGKEDKVTRVHLHGEKRPFRGVDIDGIQRLAGQKLKDSQASGKQMLFRFGTKHWLGIHLGMTGKLSIGPAKFVPGKHDHLVLFQAKRALVFTDPRQFGRVLIHEGNEPPTWWQSIGPAVTSPEFTLDRMNAFLDRRAKLAIKAALLVQKGFPGIGNWMADEILWRAGIAPKRLCAKIKTEERKRLWGQVRYVARVAIEKIGADFGDPPRNWLFHERWGGKGVCPKHKTKLRHDTVGGRSTAWCTSCQR